MLNFIDSFRKILAQKLPSEAAQYSMAPKLRQTPSSYLQNNSNPKKGAVNILLYQKEGKIKTVLILRNEYHGVHSAQVSFPGGKIEPDESIDFAALRETVEEIGLTQQSMEVIGYLSPLYIPVSNFLVHPVVSVVHSQPFFKPNNREVKRIIEFSLIELFSIYIKKETTLNTSYGKNIITPYYSIENEIVWGATAMILSELEHVVLPIKNYL